MNIPMDHIVPFTALIKKELLTSLRKRKTFALVAVTVFLCFFITGAMLLTVPPQGIGAQMTQALLMMFGYVLLSAAFLFLPGIAATGICVEKQQGSYDFLVMSLIRPFGCVAAKLINILGIFLLLFIAIMPLFGVLFFYVGIEWGQLLRMLAVILTSAFAAAAIGLFCSAFFYRTTAAMFGGYLLAFLFAGLGLLLLYLAFGFLAMILNEFTYYGNNWLRQFDRIAEEFFISASVLFSPFVTLFYAGNPSTFFGGMSRLSLYWGPWGGWVLLIATHLYHLAVAALFMRLTVRILSRPPKVEKVDTRKPIESLKVLETRRKTFPFYLIDPRRRREAIPDGRNPMFDKELFTGLLRRMTFRIRLFYGTFICCLVVAAILWAMNHARNFHEIIATTLLFETIVLMLLTPPSIATCMAKEYELGNWDMLRVTLLKPRQILLGKLFAAGVAVGPILIAVMIGLAPVYTVMDSGKEWAACISSFITMFMSILMVMCISLYVSSLCRRTATAIVASYLANFFVFAIVPLLTLIAFAIMYNLRFTMGEDEALAIITALPGPMVVRFISLEKGFRGDYGYFNGYWFTNLITSLGFSFAMFLMAVRRFRRLGGG